MSTDNLESKVARVREGFATGRSRPVEFRRRELGKLRALLTEKETELLEALNHDLGKCAFEGWISEANLLIGEIDHTLANLNRWVKPRKVATPLVLKPGAAYIRPEPLGTVLIIAPWNYPLQLALGPLIGAIAAGNTAVIKPSEVAPATSRALATLVPQYLDNDTVTIVEGGVPETTRLLDMKFDHIFYTGNGTVGRIVMKAAAEHLTPVTLELGGKSPCYVDKQVDLAVAARRIIWGKFFNAGQTCVAPDYVLAHRAIADDLVKGLAGTIMEFYGKDPEKSGDYGRIISQKHFDRLRALIPSDKVVCGGQANAATRYLAPTVLRDVDVNSPIMQEEIFGPLLPVLTVDSAEDAVAFINRRDKPLALYVFSDSADVQDALINRTSSGGACVNDTIAHLSVPDLPFGGVGASGIGAYHGKASFDTFSHQKSVLDKSTRFDVPLRYPPYDDNKIKWVRRLA